MKKLILTLSLLFLLPAAAHAADASNITPASSVTFTFGEQKFTVPTATIQSWQTPSQVSTGNLIAPTTEYIFKQSFGEQYQILPNQYNYNASAISDFLQTI